MKIKCLAALIVSLPFWAHSQSVSDRLVQNLSCQNITADKIYASIRDDAFSSHLGLNNWSTSVLANCWSISRTQRLHFYLHRTQLLTTDHATAQSEDILNMVRGSVPDLILKPLPPAEEVERPLPKFLVYEMSNDQNFPYLKARTKTSLGGEIPRTLKRDIEIYQVRRFNNPENLKKFVLSGPNSAEVNDKTTKNLMKNIDQNKLTLVNLRATKFSQHVVVVKSYKETANLIDFIVFDSNAPFSMNATVTYLKQEKIFISPDVMGPFLAKADKPMNHFIDAYIVDEDERAPIESALVKYYKSVCSNLPK